MGGSFLLGGPSIGVPLWGGPFNGGGVSAGQHFELEEGGDVGEAALQRLVRQLLRGLQGLQLEVLQDGGEEQEELHARQRLPQAQPLPWGGGRVNEAGGVN